MPLILQLTTRMTACAHKKPITNVHVFTHTQTRTHARTHARAHCVRGGRTARGRADVGAAYPGVASATANLPAQEVSSSPPSHRRALPRPDAAKSMLDAGSFKPPLNRLALSRAAPYSSLSSQREDCPLQPKDRRCHKPPRPRASLASRAPPPEPAPRIPAASLRRALGAAAHAQSGRDEAAGA